MLPFLKNKNKDAVSIIIGKLSEKNKDSNKPSITSPGDEGKDDNTIAYKSAADELLSAIKSDNSDGVVRALKSFFDICSSEMEEPEEEEEKEEEDNTSDW